MTPFFATTLGRLYCGDALDVLRGLPDGSVDCVVTSPPYWGLRDYGLKKTQWPPVSFTPLPGAPGKEIPEMESCLGLEPDPLAYTAHMVLIFRELCRVLSDSGVCWLNLGDTYSANRGYQVPDNKHCYVGNALKSSIPTGLKEKNLLGIPWRIAFALQADGWNLRQDIIWSKPNPMPESVRDRCTKSHEYIFLLSKSTKYYLDHAANQEPMEVSSLVRLCQDIDSQAGSDRVPGKTNGRMKAVGSGYTRNRRSVWTIPTQPFSQAHFATFPIELALRCIKLGCPEGGTVLDPFLGSGTTALAAESAGRRWIGIDLNEEYCRIAKDRICREPLSLFGIMAENEETTA